MNVQVKDIIPENTGCRSFIREAEWYDNIKYFDYTMSRTNIFEDGFTVNGHNVYFDNSLELEKWDDEVFVRLYFRIRTRFENGGNIDVTRYFTASSNKEKNRSFYIFGNDGVPLSMGFEMTREMDEILRKEEILVEKKEPLNDPLNVLYDEYRSILGEIRNRIDKCLAIASYKIEELGWI